MLTNSQIRKLSREQLGGKIFGQKWMMALLVGLIYTAIVGFTSSFLIGIVFAGALTLGYITVFLGIARGKEEIEIPMLFDGFKGEKLTKSIILGLLQYLFIFLWSLLFVIPGIVKLYSYSMAFYIMHDHPEYTSKQCIDESRKMMKGHKLDLFCLHLSFIGWILVGIITCGIGLFWVEPYILLAETNFYEQLKGAQETQA